MRTDLFDFELPEDRIALHPATPRDAARLLVVDPSRTPPLADRAVRDLVDLLAPGDALVLNDTRVIPAALTGVRVRGDLRSGVSFNLLRRVDGHRWRALARPAKRLAVGDRVRFGSESEGTACLLSALEARVAARLEAGEVELAFDLSGPDLDFAIAGVGEMPLPPYIAGRRAPDARDRLSYQTIYAAHDGAVAAPTAGLHFTPELFAALDERGVARHFVTLHVGAGTFLPVKAEDISGHTMHAEYGEVLEETAQALNGVRARGGRIVAVGTTSLRILESAAAADGTIRSFAGETDIFITPGYAFRAVDALMTNFHLPRSTLFMLVAAFSGLQTMKDAYAHAVASGYRFYSYGDASLLFPARKEDGHG
ncbi:tRNA preQ1(34) S-adenosylmethionine ribosyltransferase-isomerase QueA [Hyphomicrobium sp.]|uniref:tRNA preQ1(34) S-adenosylmethionine ribosyltransferase-isomerase QueA n=1 Tax=Hyphomicrobium sp. TaxID=82 RepID=UPI0025B9C97E|nr:tRNA preQ1(34) S-adenosylmethionine ribosyltransferase-isomerase QueA [Hyphomicrobium sp.]MCC7252700.1 tRNA preQ1(34) S-adenosylmethionine ribosyltransferase-isomerase QueA [Hyphomicrobium sp.]